MKIAVYTVIMGGFDEINKIHFPAEADYFIFSDRNIEAKGYNVVKSKEDISHQRRHSRLYKMCPHRFLKEYEYFIYLDGNIEMLDNPQHLVKKYLGRHDWAVLKHPWRDCIYREAEECARIGYILPDKKDIQMAVLRKDGYPEHNGLTENGVIIRRNNKKTQEFGELWYAFYMIYTQRDQLSFCYLAWKHDLKYRLIQNDIRNRFPMEFKLKDHK